MEGIKTTIPFQDAIIKNSDFKSGNYNIGWVQEFMASGASDHQPPIMELAEE